MTREEIIEGLKLLEDNMVHFDELQNDEGEWIDVHELLFEAIKALSQEPCEKSMNKAYEFGKNKGVGVYWNKQTDTVELPEAVFRYILSLVPTVNPQPLEGFIDGVHAMGYREGYKDAQKQKSGKWIRYKDNCLYNQCSYCGASHCREDNYCPNCGAKMESEEQTE